VVVSRGIVRPYPADLLRYAYKRRQAGKVFVTKWLGFRRARGNQGHLGGATGRGDMPVG
jgi:hypothetical protein